MASLGDMLVTIGIDSTALQRGLERVQQSIKGASQKLNKIGEGMKNVGSKMTAGLTLPIAGIGVAVTKIAMDFEAGMSEVQAISGATGKDLDRLKEKAKQMGSTTKFSATESAEAMKFMALAGWDTTKIVEGLDGVMNLAAASGEDLGTVADIVTDSMTGFGLAASESSKFADILAATSANANTNVTMLGEAFKYAAPLAGSLGFTAEDASHALGLMANSGIKASMAGTALRSIMTRLAKPTKESGEAIAELGIELKNQDGSMKSLREIIEQMRSSMSGLDEDQKAMYSGMLAGQNAISGMLSLVNASDKDFNKLSEAIETSEGKSKKMADTMQDNLAGQITKLKSALEGLAIQLGNIIIPMIGKLVDRYIMPLVEAFSNLSPRMQKIIVIGAGLVAVLGPLIAVIGAVASGISALVPIIAGISLPLVGWIAGIVAVIAALVLLWKNNEQFRDKVMQLWENIKSFFATTFEWIKSLAMQVWNTLVAFWEKNGEEITEKFMMVWNSISDFLSSTFEIIKGLFIVVIAIIKGLWAVFGDYIIDNAKTAFDVVTQVISGALDIITGVLDIFIGLFTGNWSKMWEGIKKVAGGAVKIVMGIIDGFIGKIETGINLFKKAIGFFTKADDEGDKAIQKAETKKTTSSKKAVGFSPYATNLQTPTFTPFAKGGIVTKPTLAMIGEGGESEAVIPLSKLKDMALGGKGVTINVTGNNIQDAADVDIIADKIANKLKFAGVY